MGIQARMRMMMSQKETIEKELLKLQVKVEDQESDFYNRQELGERFEFSKHWPSGPMLSISRFVRLFVRPCVC